MTDSIVPIVEGHSEVEAVPVLMRRLCDEWLKYPLEIGKPVRAKRHQIIKEGELERRVILAMRRPNCRAILLILDADEDCPKDLAPSLLERVKRVAHDKLVSVVLPKCELESWFIGSIESLRGVRGISSEACSPNSPETIRDAKGYLTREMEANRHYVEVDDQPAFAAEFDINQAFNNCRSFKKFYNDFRNIVDSLTSLRR